MLNLKTTALATAILVSVSAQPRPAGYAPGFQAFNLYKPEVHFTPPERAQAERAWLRAKYASHPGLQPTYNQPQTYQQPPQYNTAPPPPQYGQPVEKSASPSTVDAGNSPFEFVAEVDIGTPKQKFNMRIDSGTPIMWVNKAQPKGYGEYGSSPGRGFDGSQSSTFHPLGQPYKLDYSDGLTITGKLKEDMVSFAGVSTKSTFLLADDNVTLSSESGPVDGVFGLSLTPKQGAGGDSWLYAAAKSGKCPPVFAFVPPSQPAAPPSNSYGKRNYQKAKPAQLTVCGVDGNLPQQSMNITANGIQHGYWSVNFKGLKYGNAYIPLTQPAVPNYGTVSNYKRNNGYTPPPAPQAEAVFDTGSSYIVLPKIAADKLNKLLGAKCEKGYTTQPPSTSYSSAWWNPFAKREIRQPGVGKNGYFKSPPPTDAGLCTLPCDSKNLNPVIFTFDNGDHELNATEYIVTDQSTPQTCYSPFTSFGSNVAIVADKALASKDTLAVLGTVFTRAYVTAFAVGYQDLGLQAPPTQQTPPSYRMRHRRQMVNRADWYYPNSQMWTVRYSNWGTGR
ncbi:hypothetical protein HK104_008707 [Borealophlyctis nickersoniae]|nr:hypothetical protein HK104_008707 [Borealophlyctis nickersoniae]